MIKPLHSNLIVAITQRIDEFRGISEIRDSIDQSLARWVFSCGMLPYPVPNMLVNLSSPGADEACPLVDWLTVLSPSAIILSGGNDIGLAPSRDKTEAILLKWAAIHRLPLLGICRGMQMMAHYAGGALHPVEGHVRKRHILNGEGHDWPKEVNSFHKWGILECPLGYEKLAVAKDGTIEAFRHIDLPWEGWMWHPEREQFYSDFDTRRLKRLFNEY